MNISHWDVLVVEDEHDSVQMVADMLHHHGIQVRVTRNGHQCLAALQDALPTVIVMDLAMPEMDGWQTLQAMRSDSSTTHIPVVAITAYHSASVAQDAIQAGFDAYFPKPLDVYTFVESLKNIVDPDS